MFSRVYSGDSNQSYLYINGNRLDVSLHKTTSDDGEGRQVETTSGRMVTLEASAGDKIEVRAYIMDNDYYQIIFCAEFIPKM